jgi:hypothetical protein
MACHGTDRWHVYELKSDIRPAGASTPTDRLADARRLSGEQNFIGLRRHPQKWARYDRARNYRTVDMSLMPGYWFLVAGPANEKMDFAEGEKTPLPLLSFLSLLDLLYISFFCYLAFDCVLNDFSRVSGLYFFSFFFSELVSEFVFFDLRILGVHI